MSQSCSQDYLYGVHSMGPSGLQYFRGTVSECFLLWNFRVCGDWKPIRGGSFPVTVNVDWSIVLKEL